MRLPKVTSFASEDDPAVFTEYANPIDKFFLGSASNRWGILVHHPQVEGLVFMNGQNVTVAYFPRIVLGFDRSGNTQQVIGAVTGDMSDFNVVTATSAQLTGSTYHFVQPTQVSKGIPVTDSVQAFTEAAATSSRLPDLKGFEDVAIGAYPVVVPKLKGFTVLEGDIGNEEVFETLAEYHPLVCEWAHLLPGKFKVSQAFVDATEDLPVPTVDDSIGILFRWTLDLRVLLRDNDPNGTYMSLKKVVEDLRKVTCASEAPDPPPPPPVPRPPARVREVADDDASENGSKVSDKFSKYVAFC